MSLYQQQLGNGNGASHIHNHALVGAHSLHTNGMGLPWRDSTDDASTSSEWLRQQHERRVSQRRETDLAVPVMNDDYYRNWHNIAIMLDRVFFWVFFPLTAVTAVVCLGIIPSVNRSTEMIVDAAPIFT